MTFIYKIWNFIGHNKYWFVCVAGVVIVGFTGENSLLRHFRYQEEIRLLEADISAYDEQYEEDSKNIKALQTDPHAIARIAREQYFMKADDEDIFVFSTDINK